MRRKTRRGVEGLQGNSYSAKLCVHGSKDMRRVRTSRDVLGLVDQ